MKTTTTKELNANVYSYILGCIADEDYNGNEFNTHTERLQFLADCFKSEYVFADNLKRYGSYQNCFAEWIAGLPSSFNVAYLNSDILRIAKMWKSIPEDANESQREKILQNWFNFIAAKTMQLFNKHKITSFYL